MSEITVLEFLKTVERTAKRGDCDGVLELVRSIKSQIDPVIKKTLLLANPCCPEYPAVCETTCRPIPEILSTVGRVAKKPRKKVK